MLATTLNPFLSPAIQSFCEDNNLSQNFQLFLANLVRLYREEWRIRPFQDEPGVLALFWTRAPDGSLAQTPFMKGIQYELTEHHRLSVKCDEGYPESVVSKLNREILNLEELHLLTLPLTASDSVGLCNGVALVRHAREQAVRSLPEFHNTNRSLFSGLGWNHQDVAIEKTPNLKGLLFKGYWKGQRKIWAELAKPID